MKKLLAIAFWFIFFAGTCCGAQAATLCLQGEDYSATGGDWSGVSVSAGVTSHADKGDWMRFDNVDLSAGYTEIDVRAATQSGAAFFDFVIDPELDETTSKKRISGGQLIAKFQPGESSGGFSSYKTYTVPIYQPTEGKHTLYVYFGGVTNGVGNIDWIEFKTPTLDDARLNGVSFADSLIEPAFNKDVYSYDVTVFDDREVQKVTALMQNINARLEINGKALKQGEEFLFDSDTQKITMKVTSQDGSKILTYNFNIEKREYLENVYVSPKGTDAPENGTQAKPYKTIEYACKMAAPNRGTKINLLSGEYTVKNVILPKNTSLIGAGVSKTKITATDTHSVNGVTGNFDLSHYAIGVFGSSNCEISGFTLSGAVDGNKNISNAGNWAHGGIIVKNAENVNIYDLQIEYFNFNGIWIENAKNTHMYKSKVLESGFASQAACSSGVMFGDMEDCSFHSMLVKETRGAYAIKGGRTGWGNNNADYSGNQPYTIRNLKIYNCYLDVRQRGAWGNGQPGICIETYQSHPVNCEIYNNKISDNISLVSDMSYTIGDEKTFRVHHNDFLATRQGNGYTYQIELTMKNVEIDNNYFENGIYPISEFSGRIINLNAHHNVFYNTESHNIVFAKRLEDLSFTNNIVCTNANIPIIRVGDGKATNDTQHVSENVTMTNNIFYSTRTSPNTMLIKTEEQDMTGPWTAVLNNFTVSDNVYYNWNQVLKRVSSSESRDDSSISMTGITTNPGLDTAQFRVGANSTARSVGFENIAMQEIGLFESFPFAVTENMNKIYAYFSEGTDGGYAIKLKEGRSAKISVTAKTKSGYRLNTSGISFTYSPLNESIAKVASDGTVTAMGIGRTDILVTAQAGGVTCTSTVHVEVELGGEIHVVGLDFSETTMINHAPTGTAVQIKDGSNAPAIRYANTPTGLVDTKVRYYNGTNQYSYIEPTILLSGTRMNRITAEFWVRSENKNNLYSRLLNVHDGTNELLSIMLVGSCVRVDRKFSEGDGKFITSNGYINANEWNHIVVCYDANKTENKPDIYINGAKATMQDSNPGNVMIPKGEAVISEAPLAWSIGAQSTDGANPPSIKNHYGIKGDIAYLNVYRDIFDADTIKAMYEEHSDTFRAETGPVIINEVSQTAENYTAVLKKTEDVDAVYILASFDKDGRMLNCTYTDELTVTLPKLNNAVDATLMVWDEDQKPLVPKFNF